MYTSYRIRGQCVSERACCGSFRRRSFDAFERLFSQREEAEEPFAEVPNAPKAPDAQHRWNGSSIAFN